MKILSRFAVCLLFICAGCADHKPLPYGQEGQLSVPGNKRLVIAIAPTINISGQSQIDPLLQSDIVFEEMQRVHGMTVIPVNRVVEVYASLRISKVESEEQAQLVCDLLSCDGLVVPTITIYDPYEPPKLGASLQMFLKPRGYKRTDLVDPHELARSATPGPEQSVSTPVAMKQAVGIFDAADGTVRNRIDSYAAGRSDPNGPYGAKEIVVSMDRYCGFTYHELIVMLMNDMPQPTVAVSPTHPLEMSVAQKNEDRKSKKLGE